jgi:teichuronic acid biosynthesis glycosyltransferase TuaH
MTTPALGSGDGDEGNASARPCVACISLETWDDVWRRNQYLAHSLRAQRLVGSVIFVNPPVVGASSRRSSDNLDVITPSLRVPKRLGGLRILGAELARGVLRRADVLWINDPSLGVHCLRDGQPAIYDVTDDWRWAEAPYRIWKRIVAAEDNLAARAKTVVCSEVLRERWHLRYGVDPLVVNNGIDAEAWSTAVPRPLRGGGPHVGYVGTLHDERLDLELIESLVSRPEIGTVHLVGPNAMPTEATQRLTRNPKIILEGPVPPKEVPAWTVSFDVVISPHVVSPFTLSLDAIKSYEYLASGRPVVATPTSGFQYLSSARLVVAQGGDFVDAVVNAIGRPRTMVGVDVVGSWSDRAREFADALRWVA